MLEDATYIGVTFVNTRLAINIHRLAMNENDESKYRQNQESKQQQQQQHQKQCRVARWFVFKLKLQFLVNFGGSCEERWWYSLWTLGPFYCLLLYFMDIWYSSQ
jgi:hypothetical protein